MRGIPSHVFSTCTSTIVVCKYSEYVPNQVPQVLGRVVIQGGANLPQGHRTADMLWTPKGIATKITEADYDLLMADSIFTKMMADGYMSFGNYAADAETAAESMKAKDGSAPKVEADYKAVRNKKGGFVSGERGLTVGRSAEAIYAPD